jgi:hypothetical protein
VKLLSLLLLLSSCAGFKTGGSPQEGKTTYGYQDTSGTFRLLRETKTIKQKIVSRSQLLSASGDSTKVLEKSVTVSQLGSVKSKSGRVLVIRPMASEFTVWLEGKRYFTRMKLNPKRKSMAITMQSPEDKWNGSREVPFPKGQHFCFYSQIPECLYHSLLLDRAENAENQTIPFFVIWDSFPYTQEQFSGVGQGLFAPASLKFEGEKKKLLQYIIEVDNQILIYNFSKSKDLKKISWIAQGILIAPPGELPSGDAE